MPYTDLLKGAGKTASTPTSRESNPVRPPRKSRNAASLDSFMSSEQFLNRNPGARDLDAERTERVKSAQKRVGQRSNKGRPNMKETVRSRRGKAQREQKGWYDDSEPMSPATASLAKNKILSAAVLKVGRAAQ